MVRKIQSGAVTPSRLYSNRSPRGKQQDTQDTKDTPPILVVHGSGDDGVDIYPTYTGLVGTVVEAYNMHQNLQLRPDDIWIAVLCQFSAYINGRAEELRSKFVVHEGQKELVVNGGGHIYSANFAALTRRMLQAISENIKDASLQEWLLPGFSTSTPTDDVCASATAMCSFPTILQVCVWTLLWNSSSHIFTGSSCVSRLSSCWNLTRRRSS